MLDNNCNVYFEAERELSFTVLKEDVLSLVQSATLFVVNKIEIEQIWMEESTYLNPPLKRSTRIRKESNRMSMSPHYTLTVKHEFAVGDRIETNASITEEEYTRLKNTYLLGNVAKVVQKTRLCLIDPDSVVHHALLSADLYEGSDDVRIEFEFNHRDDLKNFTTPAWLMQLLNHYKEVKG